MNISIPESLRDFVESEVRERGYSSASEYVRELIRGARERSAREEELRQVVQLGLEQLRRGESVDLDGSSLSDFFAEAKARARQRLSTGRDAGA